MPNDLTGYVATGVATFAAGLLLRSLEPKVRLVYWYPHNFLFQLRDPSVTLQTNSLTVQNLGRKAAEGIEILHKTKPDFFQLFPALPYEEGVLETGEHFIRIANLGPREFFTLQLLSYKTVPLILNVRSSAGPGKLVQIRLQLQRHKSVQLAALILILLGLGTAVYWLIRLGEVAAHLIISR